MDQYEISLSDHEFDRVRKRVARVAGISLSDAKRTLVVARLGKIVRARGRASFSDYLDALESQEDPVAAQEFINALTTNLTRFYREDHHFVHLVTYVRKLVERRATPGSHAPARLRIWSAGCSTGQEPYTIGMALLDALPELQRWDFRILATDIDTKVLEGAATAIYPASELNGLTPERANCFERLPGGKIKVPAAAAKLVTFKPLNLLAQWPMKGPFDAIFCRNVAIYFDKPTQATLFGRFGALLNPGSFLYIGHSENLGAGRDDFRLVGKTIYQTSPAQDARNAA